MTNLTFEKALAELEQIVAKLEKGGISLNESLALFEKGVKMSRFLRSELDKAERKVEILLKDEKGNLKAEDFETEGRGDGGRRRRRLTRRKATMAKILDTVSEPADLRKLTPHELSTLAMEIRALILETVAKNGGHLGSNLGVVELTLALHMAFDSPRDKIVWDVGHQCYTHKILTGRKDRFAGLRRCDGILGFPCREESEHDTYNTGHASTALSAALGMAVARDKAGGKHHVVAVVGDGSLTGGVALEALNQIGHLRERLIIVLNFNEMSISINVGAWSKYFSYLVSGQRYIRMKDQAKSILRRVPHLGWPVIKAGRALEELVKKTLFPGLVFKELGIRYIGPVHGHNVRSLVEAFETAKTYDGPVLIQCVTQKGKGYEPARLHPEKFHGAGPFRVSTGEPLSREWGPSFSAVFGDAMIKIAGKDEKVLAITAAMGEGTGLHEFSVKLPGPLLRRRHRRTARRDVRVGPGHLRLQARRRHLLDLPPEGLRPGLPRRLPDGPARRLRPRPGRHRPRRRADPSGRQRHRLSPDDAEHDRHGPPRRERAPAHALVGARLRPPGLGPVPQGQGAGRPHG